MDCRVKPGNDERGESGDAEVADSEPTWMQGVGNTEN
jgi:hypothetical protein